MSLQKSTFFPSSVSSPRKKILYPLLVSAACHLLCSYQALAMDSEDFPQQIGTVLRKSNCNLGDEGVKREILNIANLADIRIIEMASNGLTKKTLEMFVELGKSEEKNEPEQHWRLKHLERLDLSDNPIGYEGARLIPDFHFTIHSLVLDDAFIGNRGAQYISISTKLKTLSKLSVNNNSIERNGIKSLLSSRALENLRELQMDDNSLDDDAASEFKEPTCILTQLSILSLNSTKSRLNKIFGGKTITDKGVQDLSSSSSLSNLTSLALAGHKITDTGAEFIAKSWNLQNLCFLNLSQNEIGDLGAIDLAMSRYMNLTALDLSHNPITHIGAKVIKNAIKHGGLSKLEYLNLSGNKLDSAIKDKFKKLSQNRQITIDM